MPEYSQAGRIIAVQTALGEDVLLLQRLTGDEGISRLFHFELDLLSENASISFIDIVGQRAAIGIRLPGGRTRYINGFISRFTQSGRDSRFTHYQAEVVPWLWFLTRNANCRIFQHKTVVEIIKQVFQDHGFSGYFKDKTQASYENREYVVQYRETDFNFVSRLMEEYGIFYYFEHEAGKHTMVLADATSVHQPCPNQEQAIFDSTARIVEEERITAFEIGQEFKTGAYSMNDYNFETPLTDLDVSEPTVYDIANSKAFEYYDYPGIYLKKGDGEKLAKIYMQEQEATHEVGYGSSSCGAFTAGYRFDLADHYRHDLDKTYVLTEVRHEANCGGAYYTGKAEEEETYTNHFTVIPYTVPYRPNRTTPRPFVQGPQTAVVVGPSGEEIYTDVYGRVKVQFFWDREGRRNENSSCWIRVSYPWAGKTWGGLHVPRIGQEVIVDFLEGDPDRPIIIGRVYNADQTPPFGLPAGAVISGYRTNSTKGGGGFNQMSMDDTKGNELYYVHAQRDKEKRVEHDERVSVGHDRTELVEHDERITIDNNRTEQVGVNESITIGNNRTEQVGVNESITIGSNRTEQVGSNETISIGSNRTESVGSNETVNIGMMRSLTVGVNDMVNVGAAQEITVGAAQTLSVGLGRMVSVGLEQIVTVGQMHKLTAKTIQLEAAQEIILKGPGGTIKIDSSGITIKGTKVYINC